MLETKVLPAVFAAVPATRVAKLGRRVEETIRHNVYVAPSGMLWDRYLRDAIEVVGVERIMFLVDYPFRYQSDAKAFLTRAAVTDTERAMIAHGNWERLIGASLSAVS